MNRTIAILGLAAQAAAAQTWVEQAGGTAASLRGVSAASASVVWASGTGGTYLVTEDGGRTWRAAAVPGAEALDFRDVHAVDRQTAYLLSSGAGDKSRIYKTTDGGAHWTLLFTNPDGAGFFDATAFWDARHGIVMGDPVNGRAAIFTTDDGGARWARQNPPLALPKEGGFAASGTCLVVAGTREAWFATGGEGAARVFHSTDRGRSWTVAATPVRNDGAAAGIFSLAFADSRRGVAVGGDYSKPESDAGNAAVTGDGGRTWTAPPQGPSGYRSAVVYVTAARMWVAVGTSGSDISVDDGYTWKRFDSGSYNAAAFHGKEGWAVGPKGRIAEFRAR